MYEQQILRILLDVGGRGISVQKLAKHVYNHYCTLFYQPDFDRVHRYTQYYLLSRSRRKNAIIERMGKRGCYRLTAKAARQLAQQYRQQEDAPMC